MKKCYHPRSDGENPPGKLFSESLMLAKGTSLESLYDATKLPISWLRKFRGGKIKNPSVNRIERILNALRGEGAAS